MASNSVPIRYSDESQQSDAIQKVASDIAQLLTANEEILYIAIQGPLVPVKKDSIACTTNRLIFYRPHLIAGFHLTDLQWQDIENVTMKEGVVTSEFTVNTTDGQTHTMGSLDKDQTKRLYGVAQQLEQEWREKRRIRQMEEERARAGGVILQSPSTGAAAAVPAAEDPVARLAKAKKMLEDGLISEAEYETLKAKILADL